MILIDLQKAFDTIDHKILIEKMKHMGFSNDVITEFKQINWLPLNYRFRQCLAANMFKLFDDKCPLYMKDVFDKPCISQVSTRNSTMKLSQPLRRTNNGQHCISFLAPSVWNNLPNEVKRCTNLNAFKHKVKEYFLYKIRQKDNNVYLFD